MFNFKAIYEFFFKSFVVARDVEMIERLKSEGYRSILLIKRSWIFGAASLFWLIPLCIIGVINVVLVLRHFNGSQAGYFLAAFIGFTILFTIYSSIAYIVDYRRSYGNDAKVLQTDDLLEKLRKADHSFIRCFNQLQFNILAFVVIIVAYIAHIFLISKEIDLLFASLDTVFIIIQLLNIRRMIRMIIDLEMDFNIVIRDKIYFINQLGMYSSINTLEARKIKNIRSSYPNFLSSFFYYGTLEILTEGDDTLMGHNIMEFVDQPEKTVENINSLFSGAFDARDISGNSYLAKILLKFPEASSEPERKIIIQRYLEDQDSLIQKDYHQGDEKIKQEIQEIYKTYYSE